LTYYGLPPYLQIGPPVGAWGHRRRTRLPAIASGAASRGEVGMHRDRPEPEIWRKPEMVAALAARDIAAVYRLLRRVGVSQRRIAALTGQAQSEISEIVRGRQVVSYDVLVRIADGLGVPRGHLGLAHDEATSSLAGPLPPSRDPVSGHWVVRLPVLVGSYGDAVTLFDSLTAPLASPGAITWSATPAEDFDRRWHRESQEILTRLR